MTTVLIISVITALAIFVLIKYVNFKKKKRERKPDLTIGTLKTEYSKMEYELRNRINLHRISRFNKGLKSLEINNTISTVAKEHSLAMASIFKLSHTNAFLRRAKLTKAIGIKSSKEVVAYGQGTAAGILKMWLKSPTHKKAIEGEWTKFGLSIEPSILRRNYTTCIFTK